MYSKKVFLMGRDTKLHTRDPTLPGAAWPCNEENEDQIRVDDAEVGASLLGIGSPHICLLHFFFTPLCIADLFGCSVT